MNLVRYTCDLSCRSCAEPYHFQIIVNEETSHETEEFLSKRLFAIQNQRNAGDTEELALVIGMPSCSSDFGKN